MRDVEKEEDMVFLVRVYMYNPIKTLLKLIYILIRSHFSTKVGSVIAIISTSECMTQITGVFSTS